MKKILLAGFSLFFISAVVNAQTFKPFRVDVMTGYAIPGGSGAKGGVAFSLEPKYAIIDQVSVGLRIEAAITARGWVASDGSSASADVAASGSYLATGDYYYSKRFFRPFSGVGTGIYSMASASFSANSQNGSISTGASTKFGGMIRSGFDLGHFRFVLEYNLVGKTTQTVTDANGNTLGTASAKNSYFSTKIGFFFGGGRQAKTVSGKF
jgi:outer membrane protein X